MKCQVLFSLKNNKTNFRMLSATKIFSALGVKGVFRKLRPDNGLSYYVSTLNNYT